MLEVKGKYNTAKVFTDNLEESGRVQIERLCDQPYAADSKIRMMPDVHAGAGCTIGTTMTITDKICPNLVGVDIGCQVTCIKMSKPCPEESYALLEHRWKKDIPTGFTIYDKKNVSAAIFLSDVRFAGLDMFISSLMKLNSIRSAAVRQISGMPAVLWEHWVEAITSLSVTEMKSEIFIL